MNNNRKFIDKKAAYLVLKKTNTMQSLNTLRKITNKENK
jgi:hypothetical protein